MVGFAVALYLRQREKADRFARLCDDRVAVHDTNQSRIRFESRRTRIVPHRFLAWPRLDGPVRPRRATMAPLSARLREIVLIHETTIGRLGRVRK